MTLLRSPLFSKYFAFNPKLTNFAGWEMPITFSGLIEEHNSVRNKAGLFDISHMGVISIQGLNPKDYIQKLFPTNLNSISQGQSCYTLLLNKNGGIIDDLIIYDLGLQENNLSEIFLIVNASRYENDMNWIKKNIDTDQIRVSNAKEDKALLAIQGKESFRIFEEWSAHSIDYLSPFGCDYKKIENISKQKIFFSKTGYTGEKGLEILLNKDLAISLWDFLISKNIKPCGLGARDTLRLEAGLHLYGKDINETTNPYEAGLGWVINLENNHDFYGRKILENISVNGIKRKLIGLEIKDKAIAREGCEIYKNEKLIGHVTSGSWSPSMSKAIAFAYVDIEYCKLNLELEVQIRGKRYKAIIAKRTFYKKNI
tara:strand:+ start:401 stop:1510 length:1110 start_codon:yes stop_codon:yes gene_type:complete